MSAQVEGYLCTHADCGPASRAASAPSGGRKMSPDQGEHRQRGALSLPCHQPLTERSFPGADQRKRSPAAKQRVDSEWRAPVACDLSPQATPQPARPGGSPRLARVSLAGKNGPHGAVPLPQRQRVDSELTAHRPDARLGATPSGKPPSGHLARTPGRPDRTKRCRTGRAENSELTASG